MSDDDTSSSRSASPSAQSVNSVSSDRSIQSAPKKRSSASISSRGIAILTHSEAASRNSSLHGFAFVPVAAHDEGALLRSIIFAIKRSKRSKIPKEEYSDAGHFIQPKKSISTSSASKQRRLQKDIEAWEDNLKKHKSKNQARLDETQKRINLLEAKLKVMNAKIDPKTASSVPLPSFRALPPVAESKPHIYTKPSPPMHQDSSLSTTTKSGRQVRAPPKHQDSHTVDLPQPFKDCHRLVISLIGKQKHFNAPVADLHPGLLAQYMQLIRDPMDLGTIKKKLEDEQYPDVQTFAAEVRLVWKNAQAFNPPDHAVYRCAKEMSEFFEIKLQTCGQPKLSKHKHTSSGGTNTISGSAKKLTLQQMSNTIHALNSKIEAIENSKDTSKSASKGSGVSRSSGVKRKATRLTQEEVAEIKSNITKVSPEVVEQIQKMLERVSTIENNEMSVDLNNLDPELQREIQTCLRNALGKPKKPKKPKVAATASPAPSPSVTPARPPSQSLPASWQTHRAAEESDSGSEDEASNMPRHSRETFENPARPPNRPGVLQSPYYSSGFDF